VLFEVSTTKGRRVATTVAISGMVTWKSLRTSSSRASNSKSTLSTSSMSRRVGTTLVMARSSRRCNR